MEETKCSAQTELTGCRERIEQLEAKLVSATQESQNMKSQLVVLNSNYKKALAEGAESSKQLGALQDENTELSQELLSAQSQLKRLTCSVEMKSERRHEALHAVQREAVKNAFILRKELSQLTEAIQRYKDIIVHVIIKPSNVYFIYALPPFLVEFITSAVICILGSVSWPRLLRR